MKVTSGANWILTLKIHAFILQLFIATMLKLHFSLLDSNTGCIFFAWRSQLSDSSIINGRIVLILKINCWFSVSVPLFLLNFTCIFLYKSVSFRAFTAQDLALVLCSLPVTEFIHDLVMKALLYNSFVRNHEWFTYNVWIIIVIGKMTGAFIVIIRLIYFWHASVGIPNERGAHRPLTIRLISLE